MATSPNYGWLEPDNTDLVKNGALAIRTLGNAIDTTMATMVPKSIVDAKGDLIAGTAADTAARLAVGNNGETLVADSSTATGLRYQGSYPAGKNLLINGLLDIWQRSTSVTGQANGYATIDRWYLVSSASCTFAQESTVVPTGCRYSQKVTVGASASSTQAYQAVETSNAIAYAGQNVTFSGRFQSSATPTVTLVVEYSTDVDKGLATGGWVAITATSGGSGTAGSSSFTTINGVYAIPSTAKSLRFGLYTASMASGAILYYGGFQAELGVVVTSLVRNGATLQGELAACQRYYVAWNTGSEVSDARIAMGLASSTTSAGFAIPLPVQMRVAPTTIDWTNTAVNYITAEQTITALAFTASVNNKQTAALTATVASGLTANAPYFLSTRSSNRFGLGAEL